MTGNREQNKPNPPGEQRQALELYGFAAFIRHNNPVREADHALPTALTCGAAPPEI